MLDVMLSKELSLKKLLVIDLVLTMGFALVCLGLVKIGVETQYVIPGFVVYILAMAFCISVFVIDWDVAMPNFRAWRQSR